MKLEKRIQNIEETYEFMLAYAAQGLSGDEEAGSIAEIRESLNRTGQSLEGLGETLLSEIQSRKLQTDPAYEEFAEVVKRDAANALAAVRLVLAQPVISSQLIDNLNALIHLRALLTDLFLIDEILNPEGQEDAEQDNLDSD